jgi:hypothetical protein
MIDDSHGASKTFSSVAIKKLLYGTSGSNLLPPRGFYTKPAFPPKFWRLACSMMCLMNIYGSYRPCVIYFSC